jgi:integrase
VRRRARGSIRPNTKDGAVVSWTVRAPLPPDPLTGERRRRAGNVATKGEAERLLTAWLAELDRGEAIDPTTMTVADLLATWLEADAAGRVRATTLADYTATIETHLIPRLGKRRAASLAPADVVALLARMRREGCGVRTQQLALLRLKQALAWAVAVELLPRNVAANVKAPQETAPEERIALTHDEARRFLEQAKEATSPPLCQLALSTGLRRGEGLGLRWRDLDLGRARLSVRQEVVLAGKPERPTFADVKTRASRRTLELDARLVAALQAHHARQQALRDRAPFWREDLDLVFCTNRGFPLNPNNVLRTFYAIRAASGIDPAATIHTLRHTHLTHLILGGVPIEVVARRAGHARTSITVDAYSHLLPGASAGAVAAVEAALYGEDAASATTSIVVRRTS